MCVGINSTFWTRQQLAEARQKAEFAAAREQALLEEAIEQQVWLVEQLNGVRAEIAAVRDDDTSPPLSPYSRLYRENDVAPRREIFVVAEPPPPLSAWNGGVSTMPRATAPPTSADRARSCIPRRCRSQSRARDLRAGSWSTPGCG